MKKNMKKLYSLLLVLALIVSMAAGCGKTEKSTTNSDTKKEEVKKRREKNSRDNVSADNKGSDW